MRAVAIRVNEIVGVAGFVVAGTRVDVLVSGISPGNGGAAAGNTVRTILQNITVLSAGQDFKKDTEGKPVTVQVVNLLVTPEQAQILSLAGSQMAMQLVLRNPLDTAIAVVPGITLSSMFSGETRPPARSLEPGSPVAVKHVTVAPPPVALVAVARPVQVPEAPRMEIIQGSKRTEVLLQKTEAR
jgi:pilus assembly protein CpaB